MNNIFNYATSELSQDAFLCYWLNFLKINTESNGKKYSDEAESARDFLQNIFEKRKIRIDKIEDIEIQRQYLKIDVLITINKEYYIVIEDKTHTQEHGDQINRYVENLKNTIEDKEKLVDRIIPVYYKMFNESGSKEGIITIKREDVMSILEKYSFKEDTILDQYSEYLEKIENGTNMFSTTEDISKWDNLGFFGFYESLKIKKQINEDFGDFHYNYISNRNGGFIGAWWMTEGKLVDSFEIINNIYLQFELNSKKELQLAIKISYRVPKNQAEVNKLNEEIDSLDNKIGDIDKESKRFQNKGRRIYKKIANKKTNDEEDEWRTATFQKNIVGSKIEMKEISTTISEAQKIMMDFKKIIHRV